MWKINIREHFGGPDRAQSTNDCKKARQGAASFPPEKKKRKEKKGKEKTSTHI